VTVSVLVSVLKSRWDAVELDGLDDTRPRIIDVSDVRNKSVSGHGLRQVFRRAFV